MLGFINAYGSKPQMKNKNPIFTIQLLLKWTEKY